jgi:hypothetical protein
VQHHDQQDHDWLHLKGKKLIVKGTSQSLRRPKPFQENVIGHLSVVIGEKRKT